MKLLKFGCIVERDSDGDFCIIPPANVKIFSEPGEGVLLAAETEYAAITEAEVYLSAIDEEEAFVNAGAK